MKKLVLNISILLLGASAFAQVSAERAQKIACQEAARIQFAFETSCEDDFFKPEEITSTSYGFFGQDASGDCGITVWVHRVTGQVKSDVRCN